ncbi:hypothetical protein SRB5_68930 [Streptomyces sp. RB5]|uniref:Uncharacterized protein n=1 Tax=Streptomyces smaragdinus TaxID=2585196 RepID=A0A7K0CTA2_9ACTN|nr:hypothetical protein [Streptomyces smaragdinus]
MFSVNAKPVAASPATTMPSTSPVKCRRRKRNSSSSAPAFADSSTTGATSDAVHRSASRARPTGIPDAIHSAAKLFAMIATRVAAQAPQAKANATLPQGRGSTRSIQRNASTSSGLGSVARIAPTIRPWVPVCLCTISSMITPHTANSAHTTASRGPRRRHMATLGGGTHGGYAATSGYPGSAPPPAGGDCIPPSCGGSALSASCCTRRP